MIHSARWSDTVGVPSTTNVHPVGALLFCWARTEAVTVVRPNDGSMIEPGTRVHVAWRDEDAYELQPPSTQEVR